MNSSRPSETVRIAKAAEAIRDAQAAAQCRDHLAPQRLALRFTAGVQQRDAARQVVEDQQRARRHVMQDGCARAPLVAHRQALEEAHHIVGREADQSAGQRHAGQNGQRSRRPRQGLAQAAEQLITVGRHRIVVAADGQRPRVEAHLQPIAEADERVAREPLAALDALEQEAGLERGELGEGRDRRVQITCDVEWRFQMHFLETTKNPSRWRRRWVLVRESLSG